VDGRSAANWAGEKETGLWSLLDLASAEDTGEDADSEGMMSALSRAGFRRGRCSCDRCRPPLPPLPPYDSGHGRLETFGDAVFALAATLLVVTLEVPTDYSELLDTLSRFPAFGLAFAALISLWTGHRRFFARHPLSDSWTVFLHSVLLFIVLIYVYPLKLLAEVVASRFFWASGGGPTLEPGEVRGLYLIFGAAVVATSVAMAGLYLRAWRCHADPRAVYEAGSDGLTYLGIAGLAVVGLGLAAVDVGLHWGSPIWLLVLGSPFIEALRQHRARAEEWATSPPARRRRTRRGRGLRPARS
jgi:hypothetical protein